MSDQPIEATIDGRVVKVPPGTTIFDAAQTLGITIPTVCHLPPQQPAGVCRVCCVEVRVPRDGKLARENVMAAACARELSAGMVISTGSEEVQRVRRTLVELLMADHPSPCARERETNDCELEAKARELGALPDRYRPGPPKRPPIAGWTPHDDSHPNIAVDHAACIVCDRCVRACTDVAHNNVIGRAGKGNATVITFDAGQVMGESTCVSCGECMVSCPTGALTNKGFGDARIPGEPVGAEVLLGLRWPDGTRLFEGIAPRFLEKALGPIGKNEGAVVRRRLSPRDDEPICKEGDFGSTAFFILEGEVEVSISTTQSRVHNRTGPGMLRRFALGMRSMLGREDDDEAPGATIPIDAPVDLLRAEPVARLPPGELFGEMTCLNFYPRSATVTATKDTVVLEMLRPVLQLLRRSKAFAAQVDARYRNRTIATHLRGVWCLADLDADFIHDLGKRVTLKSFEPGQAIFKQGDPADAFYLVRLGFVKVVVGLPGGELVRAYHGRGGFFGEMGLLLDKPRNASCIAVDHVDVVRIAADDFWTMLKHSPAVKDRLVAEAERRAGENRLIAATTSNVELEDFLQQGLMEAQSLLVLDLDRCTRCDLCVQACATAHDGVTRLIREGLRYDNYLVATSCRQCRDPLCMVGCPVGSIRRRDTLEIYIENWCVGCGVCADNCPYGNISMHEFDVKGDDRQRPGPRKAVAREKKATACDLCKNLAPDQDPSCVVACPHGAAVRVENPREFFATTIGVAGKHGTD